MFVELIEKLRRRHDLTEDEASAAMGEIVAGRAAPAQIAGMLIALSMKGERPHEIVGLARTMRAQAVHVARPFDEVFDTCGTGGDGMHTFNVSSLAALVLAACGVRVAKHGNRSVSSACGSADLFEALGVNVTAAPEVVEQSLANIGVVAEAAVVRSLSRHEIAGGDRVQHQVQQGGDARQSQAVEHECLVLATSRRVMIFA